ncbi:Acetyl-coenzyme A carboxylase carboxyl transferase subunit alpha chloroplastic [Bienertia sinuspersici]
MWGPATSEIMASISPASVSSTKSLASEHLRSSNSCINGVSLRELGRTRLVYGNKKVDFSVVAKLRKVKKHEYPWPEDPDPNVKGGILTHLSPFKPLKEKPKPVTLDFEKPLMDLQRKIIDVRKMANETGLDFSDQIASLENKYQQFVELHGDRAGYDDPAIVTGLGTIDGRSYMFIGQQKGRNTKENIARNFGMPTPHGWRSHSPQSQNYVWVKSTSYFHRYWSL